jgi:hypothetical protein
VVEALVRIAETDGCFAVRGTAVYVIGMVSGTEQGTPARKRTLVLAVRGWCTLFTHARNTQHRIHQGVSVWSGSAGTPRVT